MQTPKLDKIPFEVLPELPIELFTNQLNKYKQCSRVTSWGIKGRPPWHYNPDWEKVPKFLARHWAKNQFAAQGCTQVPYTNLKITFNPFSYKLTCHYVAAIKPTPRWATMVTVTIPAILSPPKIHRPKFQSGMNSITSINILVITFEYSSQ